MYNDNVIRERSFAFHFNILRNFIWRYNLWNQVTLASYNDIFLCGILPVLCSGNIHYQVTVLLTRSTLVIFSAFIFFIWLISSLLLSVIPTITIRHFPYIPLYSTRTNSFLPVLLGWNKTVSCFSSAVLYV